jgi:branched-chain amino acid transport system ATP-binding protein
MSLTASAPALERKNVCKSYGRSEIIRSASLAVMPGDRVAVIGPNGAGKSTLFNLISGRTQPNHGQISLHGRRIEGRKPFEINRLGLARSFQVTHVFGELSVFENLRCSVLRALGHGYVFWRFLANLPHVNQRAEQLMHQLQLVHQRHTQAVHLTYAEQRALELGITLASDASVLLLDEPTAGMSKSETTGFVELIRTLTLGKTLVLVEHDMSVVFGLADQVAVMVHGEIMAFDRPDAVRANPLVRQAYLGVA